jgi:hypothetical protein
VCGRNGADVRPNFKGEQEARRATMSGRHASGLTKPGLNPKEWLTSDIGSDSWRNETGATFAAARHKRHGGNGTGA